MLQPYEIYDATSEELHTELKRLKGIEGSEDLQSSIAEELEERGQSQRLSTELLALASDAACVEDEGRPEPEDISVQGSPTVERLEEGECGSVHDKEEGGESLCEEGPSTSQATNSEDAARGKGKTVIELAISAYRARRAVVRHTPSIKQARSSADPVPCHETPKSQPKHPSARPTLAKSVYSQEEQVVNSKRTPFGNVKNIECGAEPCSKKDDTPGEVETPTSDNPESPARGLANGTHRAPEIAQNSSAVNEFLAFGESVVDIQAMAHIETPTRASPPPSLDGGPRSVPKEIPIERSTAQNMDIRETVGMADSSSNAWGNSEMIPEQEIGEEHRSEAGGSSRSITPQPEGESTYEGLNPCDDNPAGSTASPTGSAPKESPIDDSPEESSAQSSTEAKSINPVEGSSSITTPHRRQGQSQCVSSTNEEYPAREPSYCTTNADLLERREASVSAGVDRWEDWDMEDGDVCSWPSTPDSSSQTRLSLSMKKPEEGVDSQPCSSRPEKDTSIEKDRKRQGIGSGRSRPPIQRSKPHTCSKIPNHADKSHSSAKHASLVSLYPSFSHIFSAFGTPSPGVSAGLGRDARCAIETTLFNKCKSFVANFASQNECSSSTAGRSICIIGTPDHPEVESVVTEAISNFEGWTIENDTDLQEQMVCFKDPDKCNELKFAVFEHISFVPAKSFEKSSQETENACVQVVWLFFLQKASVEASGPTSRPSSCFKKASTPENSCLRQWNVLWTWSSRIRVPHADLLVWQRVNHYPNSRALTRKDLFKKHLARFQAIYSNKTRPGSYFDISPTTFLLPKEYAFFVDSFNSSGKHVASHETRPNVWIVKPVSTSCGRGIHLLENPMDVSLGEPVVVQRYITNPLLIGGYKFDLRLYVLVTSFAPLEAWLYKDGFARFATEKFSLESELLDNSFVHLTNSSIQQCSDWKTVENDDGPRNPFGGCVARGSSKTSIHELWKLLDWDCEQQEVVWRQCQDVVLTALFVAQEGITNQVNSFELFGFDLIIDDSLKVWLLEANSSPSLECRTDLDKSVKVQLIKDVIRLVDPPSVNWHFLSEAMKQLVERKGKSQETAVLAEQLEGILGGCRPRQYGEIPVDCGNFEILAPSKTLHALQACKNPLP
ncbi:hypothetical protein BSKO_07498 [Bryopsis sp. KO-2023]|nr:hypothetical protein BSKO_07498 [Bryopsis sp. KO-2023]